MTLYIITMLYKSVEINIQKQSIYIAVGLMSKVFCIFSCDKAALWMVLSVCPSIRPSVCPFVTPFSLCSHHLIIMKFSGVITNDKRTCKVFAKGRGQRSKVNVTEVKTQLNRFRCVTPVWIHIWWRNDAQCLMLLKRGALLFFKVIRPISRSHGTKNRNFQQNWAFSDCNLSFDLPMALKRCTNLNVA